MLKWELRPSEESYSTNEDVHPMMCHIRDLTYSAPIKTRSPVQGRKKERRERNTHWVIPIMLRSEKCVLSGKSDQQLAAMQNVHSILVDTLWFEVSRKVILIQEQLRNNRIFVDYDDKDNLQASIVN